MKKLVTAVAATVLVVVVSTFAQSRTPPKIYSIEVEGNNVILNMQDSTWQYEKTGFYEMDDEGVYIDMTGGKILWIKADGTWTYVKSKPRQKANKQKTYPALNVTGVGTHGSLDNAMKGAINDVYVKGAASLRKNVPVGIKDIDKILQACLRDRVKENAIDQSHKQLANKQWQFSAKIALHPYQVKEVMDCVEEQVEIAAEEAAKAKEGATKAEPAKK